MRLLPRSLFGRTVLVLAAGLLLAQLASLLVNLLDRGSAVYRLSAQQIAIRIAHTARVLNRLPSEARAEVIEELAGTDLQVLLSTQPMAVSKGYAELDVYETAFARAIRRSLGKPLKTSVEITRLPRAKNARHARPDASAFDLWVGRHFYFLQPGPFVVVAQIRLEDGAYAVFVARVPQERFARLETLVPRLALWLAIFFALAVLVVRGSGGSAPCDPIVQCDADARAQLPGRAGRAAARHLARSQNADYPHAAAQRDARRRNPARQVSARP